MNGCGALNINCSAFETCKYPVPRLTLKRHTAIIHQKVGLMIPDLDRLEAISCRKRINETSHNLRSFVHHPEVSNISLPDLPSFQP